MTSRRLIQHIQKQLTLLVLFLLFPLPLTGESHLSDTYSADFRSKQFDNETLVPLKAGTVRLILPTNKGVLMKKPAKANIPVIGFGTRFRIHGDFEISASYKIPSWTQPKKGYGQGPSIYIRLSDEPETSALIGRLQRPKEGHVYSTSLSRTVDEKRKYDVKLYNTKFNSGVLRLTRNDKTISFSIKEEQNNEFIKLREVEFSDANVDLIRIGLQQSDTETPVQVIWETLDVKAESLLDLPSKLAKGEKLHQPSYNPIQTKTSIPFYWSIISCVALLILVSVMIWFKRR
ncbi:DUF1583 domain-containing protein [Gimesia aquarii]|uniref:DUF1583 domain-containing protein n=1 Tax=Gimesia aquarii TaxID=2527964 RepID=A0A517WX62_9PLAN|nr:DUF1583 domain-containing protein [Gimesia aquarii]QDU09850.1 hypothetical protein V202x_32470 [Gimesia aquarii]